MNKLSSTTNREWEWQENQNQVQLSGVAKIAATTIAFLPSHHHLQYSSSQAATAPHTTTTQGTELLIYTSEQAMD